MLDEYNHDVLEDSFYFDPTARVGRFSEAYRIFVLRSFMRVAKEKRTKRVPRSE